MINYNPNSKRFLTIAQVMTNDGTKNVKIILDVDTNIFYTLDDDGNLFEIGSHYSIISGYSQNNTITLIQQNGEEIVISNVVTTTTTKQPAPKLARTVCTPIYGELPIINGIQRQMKCWYYYETGEIYQEFMPGFGKNYQEAVDTMVITYTNPKYL